MPDLMRLDQGVGEVLPGIQPRQYQLDAVGVLAETRAKGVERGLINMATGLGKTAVATLDMHNFLTDNPDAKLLFLTHRIEIIEQAWERLMRPLGQHGLDFWYLQSGNKPEDVQDKTMVFASFQLMHRGRYEGQAMRELFDREHFDYVIVDEAHHSTAPTYQPTLEYLRPEWKLGITATPDRSDTRDIRYIFGPELFRKTLPEGISEGYLAKPHYVGIAPKMTFSIERAGAEPLETKINMASIREIAADIERRTAHIENPKIMLYASSIEEAEIYASLLPNATTLHSGISHKERATILEDFRTAKGAAITSVDILNEGVDIPDVDVIVMARSTASQTVFLQQLGRGLRGKDVLVLDYVANSARLLMISRLIEGFPGPKEEPEEKRRPARKRTAVEEISETIHAPQIELQNVTFEFDETVLDIIEIIKQRENLNQAFSTQTQEESVMIYSKLCEDAGHVLSDYELHDRLGKSGLEILLSPFWGRITDLRIASGIPALFNNPDFISIGKIAQEYNVPYMKVSSASYNLGIEETMMISSRGMMARCVRRQDIDAILKAAGPTNRRAKPVVEDFSDDDQETSTETTSFSTLKLEGLIGVTVPPRSLLRLLSDLDITPNQQTISQLELEELKVHIQHIPVAEYQSKSAEEVAMFVEVEAGEVYKLAEEMGIEGECRRSPSSNVIRIYYEKGDAADLVSVLTHDR